MEVELMMSRKILEDELVKISEIIKDCDLWYNRYTMAVERGEETIYAILKFREQVIKLAYFLVGFVSDNKHLLKDYYENPDEAEEAFRKDVNNFILYIFGEKISGVMKERDITGVQLGYTFVQEVKDALNAMVEKIKNERKKIFLEALLTRTAVVPRFEEVRKLREEEKGE